MENDEITADLEQQDTQDQDENTQDDSQDDSQNQSDSSHDDKDWKSEALKLQAILDRNKKKNFSKEPSKKSDGFDYGVKAYLKTEGIESKEFDWVESEFKNSGLKNVESLLANPYFKSQLEERRALDKTKNATIKGKSPNGIATDSVEYWLTQDFKEVPANLKSKVIEAKLAKENQKNVFYNSK
jgi:hypothetical protein